MSQRIEAIKKMKAEYDQQLKADGQAILKEEFKTFFGAHTDVVAVRWTQYTPYFNDGDVCKFGVDADAEVRFEGDNEYYNEWDSEHAEAKQVIHAASEVVASIPEDVMLAVFGDHAQVTATHDGFDVEETEHD